MKDFFESTKVKIFFSVLLVLILLSVLTRNVENNVVSSTVNTATYGISKVSAAAAQKNIGGMGYDELKEKYEALRQENRDLRARLVDYYDIAAENTRLWKFYELKKEHADYTLIPAVVLRRDVNDEFCSFTIDKGTSSDISTGDPVMGENGLIGWIAEADANTARVITVLSPRTGIGAVDSATKDNGIVKGSAKYADSNRTTFSKLDANHKVKPGDIVTTTGVSGIYPKGLVLGEVKEIEYDTYDSSYYAVLEPFDTIKTIVDVAVIIDFDGQDEVLKVTK